ncbi:uncharacterized protein F5891DRAFT_1131991 [Suillus fuscotomentosus]|uniref:DUF6830 domain-containing protein n=1 Tax=Suillus fuscotomentosus TaxID=1912939 RepID=A0AAD4HCJ7_9AGAM|nr:uncharacterized protein F5891DRAFT_1131991 [Suillus fuscotomentosus]KAG1888464.1 hypothetical protein F5891DRAFT_1131991 [Suillus fuscotomentosus]
MPFVKVEELCTHLTDDPQCNAVPISRALCQPAGPGEEHMGCYHTKSGSIYGFQRPNTFEHMKAHDYESACEHNVYYPFSGREEWELAKFLIENLNQGQISCFLKLLWVKTRQQPTFKTAPQLLTFMDALPKGPQWCCTTIETDGYVTMHLVHLIWCDTLEVMKHIFGNLIFANDMEFDPYEIFIDGEREYSEWMSSSHAHDIQACIIFYDELPRGGLEMHPTFLTIANIQSDIRMKAMAHTWSCITYMPIPQFICNPEFSSLLQACVWHRCMDIVCMNLKEAAAVGTSMVDPLGLSRYGFTPLVTYTADLPKQQMVSCHIDPWKVQEFQEAAKVSHLSGVQLPFWCDWCFADPAIFLAPELLHTCHKFFFNHILKWCKEVVGADELDTCFCSQHKHIGTHHFGQGVFHVSQMTGQEHRDIQHTIVSTITGVVDPDFVCAVRAMVDFIYKAQAPTFTPTSIADMTFSLQEFHKFKHAILRAKARRGTSGPIEHFEIPKPIPQLGSIIQFTADCKSPFERTSHQHATFTQQVIRLLDREETTCQFDLYALLHSNDMSLNNLIVNEFDEVVDMDLMLGLIMHVTPEELSRFQGPRPVRNHFLKGLLSEDSRITFHITVSSDHTNKTAPFLARLYQLPDFPLMLHSFIESVNPMLATRFQNRLLNVWNKFHIQLHSMLRPRLVMPSQQVQAYLPSTNYPRGNCDAVLLQMHSEGEEGENLDAIVAQVRMVFSLSKKGPPLPAELDQIFLYVQLFECCFVTGPDGTQVWVGMIIPLLDVTHAIKLIPVYGDRANCAVDSSTCLESYDTFYLNNFSDKEWYHTLHTDFM